jgi:hypothetical protein
VPALNVLKDVQYRTFLQPNALHYVVVKTKELTAKQVFSVPCTTCGAAVGEVCELHSGAARTEPHRDRKFSAAEAIEASETVAAKALKPQPTLKLVPATPTS